MLNTAKILKANKDKTKILKPLYVAFENFTLAPSGGSIVHTNCTRLNKRNTFYPVIVKFFYKLKIEKNDIL